MYSAHLNNLNPFDFWSLRRKSSIGHHMSSVAKGEIFLIEKAMPNYFKLTKEIGLIKWDRESKVNGSKGLKEMVRSHSF